MSRLQTASTTNGSTSTSRRTGIGKAWTAPSIIDTPARPTSSSSTHLQHRISYGSFTDSPSLGPPPVTPATDNRPSRLRFGMDALDRGGDALTDPNDERLPPNSTAGNAGSRWSTPGRWTRSHEHLVFGDSPSVGRRSTGRRGSRGTEGRGLRSSHSRATSLFLDAVGATSPPHELADLPPIDLDGSSDEDGSPRLPERVDGERDEENGDGFVGENDDDDVPQSFGRSDAGMLGEEREALLEPPGDAMRDRSRSRSRSGVATTDILNELQEKQYGVLKAEVISRRLRSKQTGWGLWTVYIGIYLLSVITSIETNALPVVEPFFLSLFGAHGLLSSVGIVTNIAYAVGKPPMAKIMDVFGRSEGVALAAAFYFVGAMLTTSAHNVVQYSIARIAAALGYQGLQLAQQIIVADTSTLASRALVTSTISSPWIITTWIGPWVGEAFKNGGETGYRSLYAVFGVLVPLVAMFMAGLLWWEWRGITRRRSRGSAIGVPGNGGSLGEGVPPSSRGTRHSRSTSSLNPSGRNGRARRYENGAKSPSPSPERGRTNRSKISGEGSAMRTTTHWRDRSALSLGRETWTQLDIVGIGLLTVGCSVVLLPLTLATRRPQSWGDPKLYILLILGVAILGFFGLYETRYSRCPILPPHLMRDRTIVAGSLLCFFHFLCQFIYESYFTSFLQVARFETARNAQYIAESYIFTACVSALICGVLVKWTCRYKIWVIVGILLHAVGAILMVRFRRLENPTWELVLSQVIAGAGGGFTTLGSQLGVQSVVSHQEVGIATAVFLTITQIGGAVGSSISGAVWTTLLPRRLRTYLPPGEHGNVERIVDDLNAALSYARGTPERDAIDNAYIDVQRILNILSLAALAPCLLSACYMKNVDLSSPSLDQAGLPLSSSGTERPEEECSLLDESESRHV